MNQFKAEDEIPCVDSMTWHWWFAQICWLQHDDNEALLRKGSGNHVWWRDSSNKFRNHVFCNAESMQISIANNDSMLIIQKIDYNHHQHISTLSIQQLVFNIASIDSAFVKDEWCCHNQIRHHNGDPWRWLPLKSWGNHVQNVEKIWKAPKVSCGKYLPSGNLT